MYAYLLFILAFMLKANYAVSQSKKSIVTADSHIKTRMTLSASLANENIACRNYLTVSAFNAETFGFAVATVFGRTYALFVSEELQTDSEHRYFLRN